MKIMQIYCCISKSSNFIKKSLENVFLSSTEDSECSDNNIKRGEKVKLIYFTKPDSVTKLIVVLNYSVYEQEGGKKITSQTPSVSRCITDS